MKVLVVDPDAARAASLVEALAATGAEASVASSASFALTMLEWNQQDVIISRAKAGDMDGHELCGFVRADPSTKGVRFVLVTNDMTGAQAIEIGVDLVIPEGLIGQAIVTRVMHLIRRDTERSSASPAAPRPSVFSIPTSPAPAGASPVAPPSPAPAAAPPTAPAAVPPMIGAPTAAAAPPVETPTPPAAVAPPAAEAPPAVAAAPPAVAAPAPPVAEKPAAPKPTLPSPSLAELEAVGLNGAMRTFQGALGTLTLEELAKAIAGRSKTGRLLLVLGTGGGMIAFDGGRIVHAEIGNTTGETALQALVAGSHRESGGKFCFIPSDPRDLANVPKTITRGVPDLLQAAARAMDEER